MQPFKLTTKDALQLKGYFMLSESRPKACILLIHGIGEHSKRYTKWLKAFKEKNFAIFAFDLRGHGLSGGKRGHTPSLEKFMDDIELVAKFAKEKASNCPFIVYGHSMGGNLVANFVLRKPIMPDGLILSSPYFRLAFQPPKWKLILGKMMANIWPTFTQSSGLDVQNISRVPEEVEKYINDPLIHNKITARLFSETHPAGEWALQHLPKCKMPFLVLHGSGDKLTDHLASKSLQNQPKFTVKIYENACHELHNETIKNDVLTDILNWLNTIKVEN